MHSTTWHDWMGLALEQAAQAAGKEEVPVGALLVGSGDSLLSCNHNRTIEFSDPTAHAEILVLRHGAQIRSNCRLTDAVLVCTLEPCLMCLGACVQARIQGLVFGARDPKSGVIFSRLHHEFDLPWLNHRFWVLEGVRDGESARLLSDFFALRRSKPDNPG
jgi:tRNA(adenine34) deaminase